MSKLICRRTYLIVKNQYKKKQNFKKLLISSHAVLYFTSESTTFTCFPLLIFIAFVRRSFYTIVTNKGKQDVFRSPGQNTYLIPIDDGVVSNFILFYFFVLFCCLLFFFLNLEINFLQFNNLTY